MSTQDDLPERADVDPPPAADDDLLALLRDDPSHWAAVPEVPGVVRLVEIAAGGQGRVYRGHRLGDDRTVAVKVLHAAAPGDEVARRRFEREVELLVDLDHPGIVPVLGHGFAGDRPYLVMDFVEGRPLHAVARDPAMDDLRRLVVLERLADAVAHAHRRGVLHRDLSPANVRVGDGDRVVVLDFGLARAIEPDAARTAISVTGDFVGSVAWAAPEQFSGDPNAADVRTDVHAIGAIGHLLFAGRSPYDREGGLPAIVRAVTEGPAPRVREHAPRLSEDLASVIDRCLARDPDDRYDAAADVRDDLRRVRRGDPIADRQSGAWRRAQRSLVRSRRLLAVTAVLALGLGAATAGAIVLAQRASDAEDRATAALADARREGRRMQQTLGVLMGALGATDPIMGTAGRPPTADDVLVAIEQRLGAPGLGPDVRAELSAELARLRLNHGEYAASETLVDDAVRLAPEDDATLRARALVVRGLARHGQDRFAEALDDLLEGARLHASEAERRREADQVRDAWQFAHDAEGARVHAAAALGALGRLEVMADLLEGVVDRTDGRVPSYPDIAAVAHRRLAELADFRDDDERALVHAERALELLGSLGRGGSFEAADVHRLRAGIALTDRRWEDAREAAATSVRLHERLLDPLHPLGVLALAFEAQASVRTGREDEARRALERIERLRAEVVTPRSRVDAEILVRVADVLALLGRGDEARAAWAEARRGDERLGPMPVLVRDAPAGPTSG